MAEHQPPQLFLIDGYALIYRAFFALISRPLRTARGENTSAVWGVTNFLLRLRDKYRPDYVVWVNDAGDSFRTAEYAEYKSTREKLDDELQADFDRAVERVSTLLDGFRIPLVEVAGYEADDVIGTLALRAADLGLEAVIVSGDKDFYQLIRPGVVLLNPGRGGPAGVEELWVTEANASERLGVPPSQVTDWLALVGDSSDNVPGVKGIGEKGAVQLLQEFGDLETLLARAGDVKQKRAREALQQQADAARLSRRLVTIKTDVPVELDLGTITAHPPDQPALARLFVELEFHSLLPRLGPGVPAPPAPALQSPASDRQMDSTGVETQSGAAAAPSTGLVLVDCNTITVSDPGELPAIAARLRAAPMVAFDCETSSLEPHDAELIGLSLAASPTEVWYFPFGHREPSSDLFQATTDTTVREPVRNLPPITSPECAPIKDLLEDATVPKAGHNVKYDVQVLRRAGVAVAGVVFDSMLASFVLDPSRRSHGIDSLSVEFFGRTMTQYTDLTGKGKQQMPFAEVAVARAAAYCGADSATVLSLHEHFAPELERAALSPLLAEIEMPLIPVLTDMEWTGIAIDAATFVDLGRELARDLDTLEPGDSAGCRRQGVQHQLAATARRRPLRGAGPAGAEEDAHRTVHRCRGARAARRNGSRAAEADPGLPRAAETQEHLRRRAAAGRESPDGADSHLVQSGRGRRPAGSRRAIPTCRTFPCALRAARAFGAASCRPRAGSSWWPTTRRSSCV